MTINNATRSAREIVQACIAQGAEHVVIAPGSRNAPLSWAFAQAEKAGAIKIHIRIDERDAGFLALGIAKATNQLVPVVVTSGSAVANLLPAVVEAFQSAVPLVILSADRPAKFRGLSAPQTIRQFEIFGNFAKASIDLEPNPKDFNHVIQTLSAAQSSRRGPVQINVQFDVPLMPDASELEWSPEFATKDVTKVTNRKLNDSTRTALNVSTNGVFVIGDNSDPDAIQEIAELAVQLAWPIIWEPSANAHSLVNSISHGVLLLQAGIAPQPEWVVTLGTVGLSRAVLTLLKNSPNHLAIHSSHSGPDLPNPVSSATQIMDQVPLLKNTPDSNWLIQWQNLAAQTHDVIASLLSLDTLSGPSGALTLWNSAQDDDQMFVAASWPVRHLEAYAPQRKGLTVFGNRGANGIDGLISTAAGVAIGSAKRTYLLMGDIAFLHDLGGLNLGTDQDEPDLTIVVLDNDGSGIFSQLEQGASEYREHYEKIFGTPHGKDLWVIAESLGIPAKQVSTVTDLKFALTNFKNIPGLKVVVCLTGNRVDENNLIKKIVDQTSKS
jgi:2-succinyl-5-enolpyruvyl-6-hydroxy-3-cyclohexene-1-carboxylate synthase